MIKGLLFSVPIIVFLVSAPLVWDAEAEPWHAPEFTARDINDDVVSLASHKGQVVLLHFWATWCGSCRREMPALENLAIDYASRGVVVLTVTAEGSRKKVTNFFKGRRPPYEIILDEGSRITRLYRVSGIPVTLLIDKYGFVVKHYAGGQDWSSQRIRAELERLLKE
jgi:thiol-disulfide isomerase/thioredoxin